MSNSHDLFTKGDEQPLRDAATVVLTRDGPTGLELYLLKRPAGSGFMGGAWVFPGGKVDSADLDFHSTLLGDAGARLKEQVVATPGRDGPSGISLGVVVAVCRELFEEAGVLLARDQQTGAALQSSDPRWPALKKGRALLVSGEGSLGALLEDNGLRLALEEVEYFAHWITPSAEKRRFDTRFFVAHLPPEQQATREENETADAKWCAAEEALGAAGRGDMFLPPPTLKTIEDVAQFETWGALRRWALANSPFPILPKIRFEDEGVTILLPWDAEYAAAAGADLDLVTPSEHPLVQGVSRIVFDGKRWRSARFAEPIPKRD